MSWSDRRLLDRLRIAHPIVLAPMAGAMNHELAAEVAEGGGLGSLPCAMLDATQIRSEVERYRARTKKPLNLNFFCHRPPELNNAREAEWRERLSPYYREFGIDPAAEVPSSNRRPFDAALCEMVIELKPDVVSFHFGLPERELFDQVKRAGIIIFSSATTVAEARFLQEQGVDAVIAQGYEAGGHRGMFLTEDIGAQPGTFALVPQVADAVTIPVIAAGGIADARGIAAAFVLGAAAVQVGTAYLACPESKISTLHRAALQEATDDGTALTTLMTGRPARGLYNRLMREFGPLAPSPAFPLAAGALAPLRAKAEAAGVTDFSPLWSGQAAALATAMPARALTAKLAAEAQALLR